METDFLKIGDYVKPFTRSNLSKTKSFYPSDL